MCDAWNVWTVEAQNAGVYVFMHVNIHLHAPIAAIMCLFTNETKKIENSWNINSLQQQQHKVHAKPKSNGSDS